MKQAETMDGKWSNSKYLSRVSEASGYLARLHWGWVLPAGVVAGVLPYLLFRLVMQLYVYIPYYLEQGAPSAEQVSQFGVLMIHWGWPALHLLLTVLAASLVARKVGERAVSHGVAVGVISVIAGQLIGFYYGPLLFGELARFLLLGVGGGLAGGFEGRATLAGQEALYRASRDIGAAGEAGDVATAIGEHLAGPDVLGVALWRIEDGGYEFVGSWLRQPSPGKEEVFEGFRLPERADDLGVDSYTVLQRRNLPAGERADSQQGKGVRSVLVLGLVAPGGERVGALAVASRRREGLSRGALRRYLTAAPQAALALRLMDRGRQVGVLRERQRVAHEIHDTLAQGFASIVMNLEAAEGRMGGNANGARQYLEGARSTARENLAEARRLVWAMKPGPLEEASLSKALEDLVGQWSHRSGVRAGCEVVGEPRELSQNKEATILRVVQEALSNAGKHAQAGQVMVTLSYVKESVMVDVSDDGEGFDSQGPISPGSGFGLGAMRERVEGEGGTLSAESTPGEGTTVVAELPLGSTPKADGGGRLERGRRVSDG